MARSLRGFLPNFFTPRFALLDSLENPYSMFIPLTQTESSGIIMKRYLLLGVFTALALIPACQKSDPAISKVAIVTNNNAEFWRLAQVGAKKAEADLNQQGLTCEVIFRMPEKGDPVLQKNIVNDMLNLGIKGLAVSVINPKEQTDFFKTIAGKVNFITMDNDAIDTGRLCYVGTENLAAGRAVGELVKRALPEGGVVAIFVGQKEPLNARERYQGVLDALAGKQGAKPEECGKYTIYKNDVITDDLDEVAALSKAKDVLEVLKNEPNVCMVGLWAYNAPKCLEAAKSKGVEKKIKIVSFDEYEDTLVGIENDLIVGTVVQDPFNFGYKSAELLVKLDKGLISKDNLPKSAVPHKVIVKTPQTGEVGVADFRAEMKRLLGK